MKLKVKVAQSCPTLWPHVLYPPWNSPDQNTGVDGHSLLQGFFPTQGSSPGLPHCRSILYQLSHEGSPRILEWVAYPFSSGSSPPRNRTRVSCIAGGFFTNWAIREALVNVQFSSVRFSSVVFDSLRPHKPQHYRPPLSITNSWGLPKLPVHWVSIAIQPSHPLSSPSPPAPNPSQHQNLFQWVSSSHQVAKVLGFQLQISPTNEHTGLISFRMDWLDLLAVQGTLKSLLQRHSSKASILQHWAFFIETLTSIHDYWKNHSLH